MAESSKKRLSFADRKKEIIKRSMPIFAEKGFDGAKTKDIAIAAGITEAMIFKIFPTKKDLFLGVLEYTLEIKETGFEKLQKVPKGFLFLFTLIDIYITECLNQKRNQQIEFAHKLVLKSLTSDGTFAKRYFSDQLSNLESMVIESIDQCIVLGQLPTKIKEDKKTVTWLVHHLLFALSICNFESPSLKLYRVSKKEMREKTLRFLLLGMGFPENLVESALY